MIALLKKQWFILALFSIILIAYLFPEMGAKTNTWSLTSFANYGIILIFFFYGVKLDLKSLISGLKNWKLHLLVQSITFLLFPILILLIKPFFQTANQQELWLGLFFLAALPSTVSSSVVMVSIAKGNIPAAIFNASISALIGVFLTPIWLGLIINFSAEEISMVSIVKDLFLKVVAPLLVGMLVHPVLGNFFTKNKSITQYFDQLIILLIVYTSFSKSFKNQEFTHFEWTFLLYLIIGLISLLGFVLLIAYFLTKILKFNTEDSIVVWFCGSKKSLVHGSVMTKVIFQNFSNLGLILLPILLFHSIQIIITSTIAEKIGKRKLV